MKYSEIKVPEGMNAYDISEEDYREYDLVGRSTPYRINAPIALILRNGGTTHRIVDAEGLTHCLPFGGDSGTVLRWKSTDHPVSF